MPDRLVDISEVQEECLLLFNSQILHTLGLTDILVDIVATEELGNIATGIIGMSSYPGAIETFLNRNVVEKLFGIIAKLSFYYLVLVFLNFSSLQLYLRIH